MLKGEILPEVAITSFRRQRGRWLEYRKISLGRAFISPFGQKPDASEPADDATEVEEVAITYTEVTWEYEDGGAEHHDNWEEGQ